MTTISDDFIDVVSRVALGRVRVVKESSDAIPDNEQAFHNPDKVRLADDPGISSGQKRER